MALTWLENIDGLVPWRLATYSCHPEAFTAGDRWCLRRGIMTLPALVEHLDVSNKNRQCVPHLFRLLCDLCRHGGMTGIWYSVFHAFMRPQSQRSMTNSTGDPCLNAHASMGRSHTDRHWPPPVASSFSYSDRAFD